MGNFTYYIISVSPFLRSCLRMALSNVLTIYHLLFTEILSSSFFKKKIFCSFTFYLAA